MKAKEYKYERLCESDACMALGSGIARLTPKGKVYHAANYVLHYTQSGNINEPIVITLEDKKQSFKCVITFGTFTTSISVTKGADGIEPNYSKAKSGLRQMLAAIVLYDHAQMVIPKVY